MARFKAVEIAFKPHLIWMSGNWPVNDPLVLDEVDIPATQFGVSPLKIVDGELVNRTTAEMEAFEAEFILEQALRAQEQKYQDVLNATFSYLGIAFPMTAAAHLRYLAIENQRPATVNVQAINRVVPITAAEIDAFIGEYYKEVLDITSV